MARQAYGGARHLPLMLQENMRSPIKEHVKYVAYGRSQQGALRHIIAGKILVLWASAAAGDRRFAGAIYHAQARLI